MHEFSVGESLVKALLEEMARMGAPPPRVRRVRVVAGALQAIVPENLRLAFEVLTRDTPAQGAELEVKMAPVRLSCAACGWNGPTSDGVYVCAECGERHVDVTAGRELYLDSLEIDDGDNSDH